MPILSTIEKAAQEGLREVAKQTLKLSNELAPQDDKDLIRSGRVRVDDLTSQVSYTAVHAPLQHEHLDWEHADGGQAKFLEAAEQQVDVETVMGAKVKAALGG